MKLTFKTAKSYLESGKPFKAKSDRYSNGSTTFICMYGDVLRLECGGHFTEEDFNAYYFQFISFLPRKIHKVGDNVIITDDIKETDGWHSSDSCLLGVKLVVQKVYDGLGGLSYMVNDDRLIGAEYLIADTEEETMPELKPVQEGFNDLIIALEKASKELTNK